MYIPVQVPKGCCGGAYVAAHGCIHLGEFAHKGPVAGSLKMAAWIPHIMKAMSVITSSAFVSTGYKMLYAFRQVTLAMFLPYRISFGYKEKPCLRFVQLSTRNSLCNQVGIPL
jgi:hypothetical protein